ncbi:MAG: TrkA family potassium uptake protein [Halobaculum sp.]
MASISRLSSLGGLSRRNRLVAYYLLGLAALVVAYALAYNYLLYRLEGVDQSIFASFEFVVQTMTTTGYGQDSGLWSHPVMFLFVAGTQISGIALGFFTLRLVVIPLFTGAEVDLDSRLSPKQDHVIVCEYSRDSTVLLDELDQLGIEYVLLSSSREDAKRLSDAGYAAIEGSPQDASAFERASLGAARAVVTDTGDDTVNTILTVRSVRSDVEVISLTDDSDLEEILRDTGADSVLSPQGVLGYRLAEKAVSSFSSELTGSVDVAEDFEVTEIPIHHGSRLLGTRIRDSNLREGAGATVIAAWIDGELQLPPDPDAIIRANTVLLVAGDHESLSAFSDFNRPARSFQRHDRIVIAGYGEAGRAAASVVTDAGLDAEVVDREAKDGVDTVGDAGSKETLRAAGIESADALVVALPDDSAALLTTVLARSLNPDVEILVRLSDTNATEKALRAGADYVLSVPRVSARLVAKELRGEEVLAPASQIRFVRVPATPFAGKTLANSKIYEQTGCRVIAVETDDGASDDSQAEPIQQGAVDPQRTFTGDERLTLVGSDEAVQSFLRRYDVSTAEPKPRADDV